MNKSQQGPLAWMKELDAFPKLGDEFRVRTTHGALASIVAICTMVYLFISEYTFYSQIDVVDRLVVNSTTFEHLRVSFDIAFPHIPCGLLSLDAMDSAGQQQEGVVHNVFKRKLTDGGLTKPERQGSLGTLKKEDELQEGEKQEVKCGNCYGSVDDPNACCNTCEEVREAYLKKGWAFRPDTIDQCVHDRVTTSIDATGDEGCEVFGSVDLSQITGNIHFAPGEHMGAVSRSGHMSIAELMSFTFQAFNVSHTVKSLSFGYQFPGITNPLDNQERHVSDGHGMYQYYVKVVPTVYKYLNGREIISNQYSVTEHLRHVTPGSGRGMPGVWFFYEVSPVQAVFEERKRGFLEFLTSVCAILGGVFTIIGVFDEFIGYTMRKFGRRGELGL